MALHTDLPIHKKGADLLQLAIAAQAQMPRTVKRLLGDKITSHCIEMLDLMAMANASQRGERAALIRELLRHARTLTVLMRVSHKSRYISTTVWADSVQMLESIGKQGSGWLKSAQKTAPAA
jgi:hypothetical protein